ncbi:hypothetical protein Deipr_1876 [Deinococcus proteolyticus MRP]|uniref:Uncharacterized protein n=1 Tax=Deinococcus proteolyticus (strain ATCC 35074 / DSM 20540 / JCM 6276 / NBRC 101906 / NCIMB 13154 / VKM Ac-1939 / CCM 2703 / MRP) TaxID=693977 RepID=F0RLZ8_DEIPM|nr:hypothetical protein Deipr_1876 [Deinococcus proteolyticus MRP]
MLGTALADTRVPNSKVSYNSDMVFIDEQSSTGGKTYVAFVCESYGVAFRLYSKNPLSTEKEFAKSSAMSIIAYADGEKLGYAQGSVRRDRQTGQLGVWETTGGLSSALYTAFIDADSSISVTALRNGYDPVTYRFPTKGLLTGLKAINYCR